ncbi:MAG: hypothetical protein HXY38_14700 [Chloroflexi bacterium]|nr:hypothetical protein [Chloroflexota bacterium]
MKKLMTVRGFILLTAALFLLAACGPGQTPHASDATEAAPLPQAEATVQTETATVVSRDLLLDPAKTEDPDSLLISRSIYEGLVTLDADGNIQPGIAQSWTVSDDELDYIFEIRPDAFFNDGAPITVDEIENNFNRWFDPQHPLHGDGNYPSWLKLFLAFNGERDADDRSVSQIDGVQKVDINTFLIHLNRPDPQLLTYLADPAFAILKSDSLSNPAYGTRASTIIASGPYAVTSWTEEGLILSPNPQYWNPVDGEEIRFIFK